MLSPDHFRKYVIIPSLRSLPRPMQTSAAVELLLGTALVESRLTHLRQSLVIIGDGRGRALGLYQIEPNTHRDVWENYLGSRKGLADAIGGRRIDEALMTDLRYATLMARIIYWRSPQKLPDRKDIRGLGEVWKTVYNTAEGAGDIDTFVDLYTQYALPTNSGGRVLPFSKKSPEQGNKP